MEEKKFVIDSLDRIWRLDAFLADKEPGYSRTQVKEHILNGFVKVNAKIVRPNHKLKAGDELCWNFPESGPFRVEADDIPLDLLYEDQDILILDKPVGLVVHPGAGCRNKTLVNALLHYTSQLSRLSEERPGIVHRLDKDTSGVMVVARNNQAHLKLARQFKKHSIFRRYIALVEGSVGFDEGIVDVPIRRHFADRRKMMAGFSEDAREAQTFYRVLKRFPSYTALELFPQTGRTHQLRVHMNYLGHPILGDPVYGKKIHFSRLALHAKDLGFLHPSTGEKVEFSSPLPPEMKKAMEGARVEILGVRGHGAEKKNRYPKRDILQRHK